MIGTALRHLFGERMGLRNLDGYAAPDSVENRSNIARFAVQQGLAVAALALAGVAGLVLAGTEPRGMHTGWLLALLGASILF